MHHCFFYSSQPQLCIKFWQHPILSVQYSLKALNLFPSCQSLCSPFLQSGFLFLQWFVLSHQCLIPFLILFLILHNFTVLPNISLHLFRNSHFLRFQFLQLTLQICTVRKQFQHHLTVFQNCFSLLQQFLNGCLKPLLYDALLQMGCLAFAHPLEFVIALPDHLPVFAVGMPDLCPEEISTVTADKPGSKYALSIVLPP